MTINRRTILSLAAGTALGAAIRPAFAAGEPISIGAVIPTTGPMSLSGKQYFNTLTMAEEDINKAGGINGRPVKFVIQDAGSSNSTAVSAFMKLIQETKPPFAFLTSYSTQNLATAPEVVKAKIPVMYAGGADAVAESSNGWMFRIRPTDSLAARGMAQFVKTLKATKPGILYIQNDFGQGGAQAAAKLLEANGTAPVGMEAYGQNDKDFSAQILRLRQKGADVILTFVYPADGALLLRQIKALGLKTPIVASSASFLPAALQLLSPADLENVWGVIDTFVDASVGGRMTDFTTRYKAKFGQDGDAYGLAYYDGALLLAEGLKKVGTDPEKLRDFIASQKSWEGIGQTFSFDDKGNGVPGVVVVKAKPGTKTIELVERIRPS
ncbi:ABC transporter substrate-binding protein [Enterovirga rhinocerotis]|uniref:Amino acid/amide ABC transporter substrate-binding protein (HAAT family) n=1 Tax=Enterovirga rhinocerotis TaxID=1339210 RepID=A0A4R7BU06_9HYPH|nr:ABC transporter substrate-binding protein [Enterovirga rhinocerotis]TDR88055.1 amino acid/amide ABC transporter substrate-binding protein (HAAT family) [Enterovirga rhinocerotis]